MESRPFIARLPFGEPRPVATVKIAGINAFDPAAVLYLEGNSNYTTIYFSDGRKQLTAVTLLRVLDQLPALIRIHKSYAIAPAYISYLRWMSVTSGRRQLIVTMRNGVRLPVPRRKATQLAPELAQLAGMTIQ